ncbi:MAG: hypothetical protein HY869_19105 [Chloroflexi bacterium]|nr:hypothetical protein [Chloroflexota bacterium]
MHPTLGILARFQAFFYALSFFQSDGVPPPTPARVTQTVETVEKVTFQKLFLKSGRGTLKSSWFLVFRTTFWQYFGCFLACCGSFFELFSNQEFFDSLVGWLR